MATKLSDLRTPIRALYESSATTRLSNDRLDEAINDALDELSERTEFYETFAVLEPKANRIYYDLRGLLPDTYIRVTGIWSTSNDIWLEYRPHTKLEYAEWEKTTGDPLAWFMRGLFSLGIFPHPSSTSGKLHVYFKALHPKLVNDYDIVRDLPADFESAIEDYALYELYAQDRATDKALLKFGEFERRADELAEVVTRGTARGRTGRIGGRR